MMTWDECLSNIRRGLLHNHMILLLSRWSTSNLKNDHLLSNLNKLHMKACLGLTVSQNHNMLVDMITVYHDARYIDLINQ